MSSPHPLGDSPVSRAGGNRLGCVSPAMDGSGKASWSRVVSKAALLSDHVDPKSSDRMVQNKMSIE